MVTLAVEDVLEQLGIKVSTVGREISARCPFHEDRHPSFSINPQNGLWVCFQCQRSGNLEQLIESCEGGLGKLDAESIMRETRFRALKARSAAKPRPDPTIEPHYLAARFESFREVPDWALEERFLERQVAQRYSIRWEKGWVIPVWSPAGGLWGWQFKRLDVVLNYPPAMKKGQTLFGLREFAGGDVWLVESPLDVVRLACVGVPAVASFGAMVSRAQVRLVIDAAEKIHLAMDADKEGQDQTRKLYPVLSRAVPTRIVEMPPGRKDPGECTDEEIEALR